MLDTYGVKYLRTKNIIRKGLEMLPWKEHNIKVVEVLKNGIEAEEWIHSNEVDILLTDIRMPGISGVKLAKIALENALGIKEIILTRRKLYENRKNESCNCRLWCN